MHRPVLPLLLCLIAAACADGTVAGPTIRVALDEQFSRKLIEGFGAELGVEIKQLHDSESQKTVGHVSALKSEKNAPRCDVFWNNELAHTVHLAHEGMLEPYVSPAAADIPARWKDPNGLWTGFAARARILIVNTEVLPDPEDWPQSYKDLVDAKWKGRCAVAKPLTGTTLTHFAALRLLLGEAAFDEFFDEMENNDVKFLSSNAATMREVRENKLAWAFTDTDDYHVARKLGFPVACVFPDQGADEIGTMLIPNSIAIIKGGPDPEGARRLVDKILARDTEARLAAARGAQMPVRDGIPGPDDPSILGRGKFKEMGWDIEAVARSLAAASRHFGQRFGM